MGLITEDFMLQNEVAKHLYHDFVEDMPIFDYHCHLDPKQIAEDYQFEDIWDLWLAGDHYKWRAIRSMGIPEREITGDASHKDKFHAWAKTVPNTLMNPLFHWTALELKRYFGIDELLDESNWEEVWEKCNKKIKEEGMSARQLIQNSNVNFVCTTDAPYDSLEYHEAIAKDDNFNVTVVPGFRPDEFYKIGEPAFLDFLKKMEAVNGIVIDSFKKLVESMADRVQYFKDHGSMVSDQSLSNLVFAPYTEEEIENIFQKAIHEEHLSLEEKEKFLTAQLVEIGKVYHDKEFVYQIHFGALRNGNSRLASVLGPDSGFDSMGASANAVANTLNALLDEMNKTDQLPRFIIYPLNPTYNAELASVLQNFQSNNEGIKSKLQLGAGWWFNDTEDGMLNQMRTFADNGLLMHFVGMLTDSRSFISYTRHDYFRRIFCNFVGTAVEEGKLPCDDVLLERFVKGVAYNNATQYFGFNK